MSNTRDTGFLRNAIQVTDQGVTFVSGSTTLMSISYSGAVTTTGVISGSNALSASFSLNSALLNGIGSVGFATTGALLEVSSSQQQISSSQQQISASLLNVVANYATTGSNSFRANQSITGSLVVSSTITAQTLVVQTVTSSIVYSSGSNLFGSALGDTQTFTGSLQVTGSMSVTGSAAFSSDVILPYSKALAFNSISNQYITADSSNLYLGAANLARLTISSSGLVGIGTTSPNAKLHINGSTGSPTYRGFVYTYAGNETLTDEVLFQAVVDGYTSVYPLYLFRDQRTTQTGTQRIFEIQGGISGVGTILTTLANGYVGIGTTSPAEKLHVSGGAIKVQGDTAANTANAAALSYASGYASLNSWGPNTSTWGGIKFILNASNGNAITALTLSGSGAAIFSNSLGINGATSTNGVLEVLKSSSSIAQFSLGWNTSNHTDMYVDASGNFYIQPQGTTKFTISSTGAATIAGALTIQADTGLTKYYLTSAGSGDALNQFYDNTGTVKIQLYTNGNSYFTGGSVGIGTTSPNTKLEVYSSTAATATIGRFGAANYNYPSNKTYIQIGTQYEDGSSKIGSSNPSGNLSELFFETCTAASGVFAERMRINSSGSVGINTSSPTLNVGLTAKRPTGTGWIIDALNSSNTRVGGFYVTGGGNGQLYLANNSGTENIVLDSAGSSYLIGGNLGIGTSLPLATLSTIGGAVQFMGDYRNYQTIIKNAGGNGTFNGSLLITIPQMSDGNTDGYGGYSCEVYVAGYSGFYCHAWFGGYINGGITSSEATILRSNGGWSISQVSYGANNQGFQFTIDYPSSIVHPTARIIFNKGGSPNSAAYPANTITSAFS